MTTFKNFILPAFSILALSACASSSPESDPSYVSPTHYSNYNCNQIAAEMQRIQNKLQQGEQSQSANLVGQVLNTAITGYAISQGYGFTEADNSQQQRLINLYDVLEQTAIQKECNL